MFIIVLHHSEKSMFILVEHKIVFCQIFVFMIHFSIGDRSGLQTSQSITHRPCMMPHHAFVMQTEVLHCPAETTTDLYRKMMP